MRKWFVMWATPAVDDQWHLEVFEHEKEVTALLNRYADANGFEFRVILGDEVRYEPKTVVKEYQRKR